MKIKEVRNTLKCNVLFWMLCSSGWNKMKNISKTILCLVVPQLHALSSFDDWTEKDRAAFNTVGTKL